MRYLYLCLVVVACSEFFYLIPMESDRLAGGLKLGDLALGLLLPGVLLLIYKEQERSILFNLFTWLVVILFFFIALQAGMASLNYNQSIPSGLVTSRKYWFYLSFVLFVFLLDDSKKAGKFLDMLSWIAIGLFVLAIINYFYPVVFHHKWAEGHNVRAGMKRAFIPGMDVLTVAAIWQFTKWIEYYGSRVRSGWATAIIYAAHVFRQSRGRLLSLTLVIIGMLIFKRRYKESFIAALVALIGFAVLQYTMPENILEYAFESTAEDLTEGTGTWGGRMVDLERDLDYFLENIYFGDGLAVLRLSEGGGYSQKEIDAMKELAGTDDLGYSRWLRNFGVIGMFWLAALFYFFISRIIRANKLLRKEEDRVMVVFVYSYCGFMAISLITLNHLMLPPRILLLCFCAAMLVRINWNAMKERSKRAAL